MRLLTKIKKNYLSIKCIFYRKYIFVIENVKSTKLFDTSIIFSSLLHLSLGYSKCILYAAYTHNHAQSFIRIGHTTNITKTIKHID